MVIKTFNETLPSDPQQYSQVSTQDYQDGSETNCEYLNTVRANYTACCEYPLLVVWQWQMRRCSDPCNNTTGDLEFCCVISCCFNSLGIIRTVVNDDASTQIDIDTQGLIYSLMLSVGNDTQWHLVITNSAERCYSQFSATGEFECDGQIPAHLFSIADCVYIENFLKCAKWNPNVLIECDATYKYVKGCFSDKAPDSEFEANAGFGRDI